MRTRRSFFAAACLSLALSGCATEPAKTVKAPDHALAKPVAKSPWDADILAAAAQYKSWKRVSDITNWAPYSCSPPMPDGALTSEAASSTAHGRKLYYLFAKADREYWFYPSPNGISKSANEEISSGQPVGQILIKEAFVPVPATGAEAASAMTQADRDERRWLPPNFAITESELFRTGEPAGLFAMLKFASNTPGTDIGWIYATISPQGEITSVGAVESCMACHVKAPYDRLFGPKWIRRDAAKNPLAPLMEMLQPR